MLSNPYNLTFFTRFNASPRGALLYVHSGTGSDSRSRLTFFGSATSAQGPQGDPTTPLASVFGANGALSYCSAGKGDLVIVLPGHAENLSTNGLYAIPANVIIVGIGNRSTRPTFTLTGGTATAITPGADSQMDNCVVSATGVDAIVKAFNCTGAGFKFSNGRALMATASKQALNAFTIAAADVVIQDSEIDATAAAGAATAIISSAAVARLKVIGCDIRGDFSVAPLNSTGSNHITLMRISNNVIVNLNGTAKVVVDLTTSSTGMIDYNRFIGTTWAAATDAIANSSSTGLRWIENYGFDDGAGAVSGILIPAAGTLA